MQSLLIPAVATVEPEVKQGTVLHNVEETFVVPTSSSRINNGFFLKCLDNTVAALESDSKIQDEEGLKKAIKILSSPATNRPHVFAAKVIDDTGKKLVLDYVNNVASFREMLEVLTDFELVSSYCGSDASDVSVFTGRLPEDWVARVPYVRFRHVPQTYKHNKQVYMYEIGVVKKGQGDRECLHACRELYPLWSNKRVGEIPAGDIYRAYHCVTIKVNNRDGTIKMWNPGLDKNSAPCMSMQDTFVLVGLPHPKKDAAGRPIEGDVAQESAQ